MGKVQEKLNSFLGVWVNFQVDDEITKKYDIRRRDGELIKAGGSVRYKVSNVAELQEVLTYEPQDYIANLNEENARYLLPLRTKEGFNIQDYRIEDGDVSVKSSMTATFGDYANLGYVASFTTPHVEEVTSKSNRLYANVKYADEFKTIQGGIAHGEQRRKEQAVTLNAEHEVKVEFTTGEIVSLVDNYLAELQRHVKEGKTIQKLTTVIYSQESNLKFVQELTSEGLEAWYEEIEEADLPVIKKLRNFGGRGAVLYSRHKNVQIHVDGKKNVYVARYGTEHTWRNGDKVVVAKWDCIEGNEEEIWKVYDEEVSKQG